MTKKGTFFQVVTVTNDFVFVKKGWRHLYLSLDRYNMDVSHAKYIDLEGFYDLLRERIKASCMVQQVYFPEDIIINIFSL